MASNLSLNLTDSDVFYVEQSSNDQNIPRPNTPIVLSSTEVSGDDTRETISISSIASPEPQIVTIDDDSNEPTMKYGFGRQLPIIPPSVNDLNLRPNSFNILATMAVASNTEETNDDNYSPQLPDPSELSPISMPPKNVSAFNSWETSYTTTNDDTIHSSDEPRRICFLSPSPSPQPSPPRRPKIKLSLGKSFPKEGECRSTSAKPADRRSLQQRTSQVHREGNRTVEILKLTHKLSFHSFKHSFQHLLIDLYLRIRSRYVST